MEIGTKNCSLVRPSQQRSKSSSLRVIISGFSAFALVAAVCVLFDVSRGNGGNSKLSQVAALAFGDSSFHVDASAVSREGSVRNNVKPDFVPPLGKLGEVGLKVEAKPQALAVSKIKTLPSLAFGDASFHSDDPTSVKEGSVRKGIKPDFVPPLGTLGEVGLQSGVKPQALAIASHKADSKLAFGDFSIHSDPSPNTKEGSIREGVKPDYLPPLGSLGEVGLKSGVVPQALAASQPRNPLAQLAFGDAVFQPEKESPAAREGGVREGVKPDFVPPIGDLGEIGLAKKSPVALHGQSLSLKPDVDATQNRPAAKPKIVSHSSALAFGDATFVPSQSTPLSREGSVRGGKRPDFKPPIGDLGEVGLKAAVKGQTLAAAKKPAVPLVKNVAHGAKMSADSSRADVERFYQDQLRVLKGAKPALREDAHHLSAAKARAGLEAFYEAKAKRDTLSNSDVHASKAGSMSDTKAREGLEAFFASKAVEAKAAQAKVKKASTKTALQGLSAYYAGKKAEDAAQHLKAIQAATADAKAEHSKLLQYYAAQARAVAAGTARRMVVQASKPEAKGPAAKVGVAAAQPHIQAAVAAGKAKTEMQKSAAPSQMMAAKEALASLPLSIFAAHKEENKHGFHSGHVAIGKARKELDEAGAIAKEDLDDCGFTLC